MLIFFIHGVATRDAKYADSLQELLRQEFAKRKKPLPHFYSGFWGSVLNDLGKVWNWIYRDLEHLKANQPEIRTDDIFRYQNFRRGSLSEFAGDAATYLNKERGAKIRGMLADQLEDFVSRFPDESEIHIVAHSLGTVVLWDVLFSDQLSDDAATLKLRSLIKGFDQSEQKQGIRLRSITTMGSPILMFNLMMDISREKVQAFIQDYDQPLRWVNIIHASDVIAYPLSSSLNVASDVKLELEDKFLHTHGNDLERSLQYFISSSIVQALGKSSIDALSIAPMAAGSGEAHTSYWNCKETAHLVANNLLAEASNDINRVVRYLLSVPGMTEKRSSAEHLNDETLAELSFRDHSGTLRLCINFAKIHHVFVYDAHAQLEFGGYVGWIHSDGLKRAIAFIQENFC